MPSISVTLPRAGETRNKALFEISGRCVACGLCLPHCPTYRKTLSEADSPRGRIMLMRGVLEQRIPANPRFFQHIDSCLTCRACERVCPSGVAYGALVDGMRAEVAGARQKPISRLRRFALKQLIARPRRLQMLAPLLRRLQATGLLRRLAGEYAAAPRLESVAWREEYPAHGTPRGEVALFLGCIARVSDVATLDAAIYVLNRLGYTVRVPRVQTCCGALHRRDGDTVAAERLDAANTAAFAGLGLAAIISTASGCGAQLSGLRQQQVVDVSAFLTAAQGWEGVQIQPLAATAAVHDPCTLRNVQRAENFPYQLLARIPQLQIEALAGNDQCCGAAGTYFLDQPQMAQRLRDDKMQALRACGAQYLATSNVGCAMYLADGLRAEGRVIEVLHPVTLLARQMGYHGNSS